MANAPATTAIIKASDFEIVKNNPDEVMAMLAGNLGRLGVDQFSLPKALFPSGKATAFQIATIEGDQYFQAITGVVIGFRDVRVYWESEIGDGGGGSPPDCTSEDMEVGHGKPGGPCATCPMATFGSKLRQGQPTKGQACQQRRLLFIMRPDSILPLVVSLPPTSVQGCHKFFIALIEKGLPYYGAVIEIGLGKEKSDGGVDYCEATFKVVEKFDADTRAKFKGVAEKFRPHLSRVRAGESQTNASARPAAGPGGTPQGGKPVDDSNPLPPAAEKVEVKTRRGPAK